MAAILKLILRLIEKTILPVSCYKIIKRNAFKKLVEVGGLKPKSIGRACWIMVD
jgi:hypothetical protein